jgi:hypothetical protein
MSPPARLLQSTPLMLGKVSGGTSSSSSLSSVGSDNTISGSFSSSSNFTAGGSGFEGLWNTSKGDTIIFSSNSSTNFSFSSDGTKTTFNYSSYTSTELIVELRRGSLDLKQIDYKLVQLNDRVYKSLMDADGILDGSKLTKEQLNSLYDPNALPSTQASKLAPQLFQSIQPPPTAQSSSAMTVAPTARSSAAAAPSSPDPIFNQSNQVFNEIFSTNGFIIKSAANSIDTIYYFELTSLDIGSSPPSGLQRAAPAFFRSVPPPTIPDNGGSDPCQDGNIVMKLVAVDLIKRTPKPVCIRCNPGEVFSAAKRACVRPEQLKVIKKLFCEVKG